MSTKDDVRKDDQQPEGKSIWSKLYKLEASIQQQVDTSLRKRQRMEGAKRFSFLMVGIFGLAVAIVSYLFTSGILRVEEVNKYYLTIVGLLVAITVFAIYITDFSSFVDIDDVRAMARSARLGPDENPTLTEDAASSMSILPDKFNQAIHFIGRDLVESADDSNRKASKMLDTGKRIAVLGFVFFAVSIVFWQWYFYKVGFAQWHVYGMISCASLFLAAEIVSAWFLKQYRHFVDASTNYIRIKAIFDRYLLLKLASDEDSPQHSVNKAIFEVLSRDIVWPISGVGSSGAATVDGLKSLESILSSVAKIPPQRPEK